MFFRRYYNHLSNLSPYLQISQPAQGPLLPFTGAAHSYTSEINFSQLVLLLPFDLFVKIYNLHVNYFPDVCADI